MSTSISEHARQEEEKILNRIQQAIDSATAAKEEEIKRLYRLLDLQGAQQWGIDNLASLDAITQERDRLKEATAAKEGEIERLKDKIGDIAAEKGVVLYEDWIADTEALESRVCELEQQLAESYKQP